MIITGAFGLGRLHFERALDLLAKTRVVAPFVTHRFELPQISTALTSAEQGSAIKVAIMNG